MGKFIIKKNSAGKYMFNLKAGNGEVIATSEAYESKDSCKKGIESVRKNAVEAVLEDQTIKGFPEQLNPKFVIFKDKAEKFRFHLKAINGEIILASGSYTVKASCKNGIDSVRKNAPNGEILVQE